MKKHSKIILEQIDIPEVRKTEALKNVARAVEEKAYVYQPSRWEVFCGQVKYISGFCLGGQALCLLLLILVFGYLQEKGADLLTYLGITSVLASYLGIFLMLELSRSKSFRMLEIEQTCYLNLKQVWCVKMILFGCLDILLLTAMIVGVAKHAACSMFQVMVYLLVPFVISNGLQLWVFTMFSRGKKEYLQIGTAVLVSAASLFPLNFPEWYTITYFGIWMLALVLALGFLVAEAVKVYRKLEEGDEICWN